MLHIISSILPIFIITLLGKLIKTHWLKAEEFWRGLESLSYFMLFPVVLFNYISTADLHASYLSKIISALIISTLIVASGLAVAQRRFKIEGRTFTSIFQGGIRYNSYIFFGLGGALYGTEGMEIVAIIAAYMIIFTNFLSVLAFTIYCAHDNGESENIYATQTVLFFRNLITNPLIIASVCGFIFNYFEIEIADSVKNTLQTLSDSALAIGILCVGASMRFSNVRFEKFAVSLSCFTKLIILPSVTFIALKFFGVEGVAHSVSMLYSLLPTATNSYLLSKQLGGDSETMTSIITFSTALSVLSLAVLIYILT